MNASTLIRTECGRCMPCALVARALRGASRKANFEGGISNE